ncbi:unnamed protein product [Rhodiola kirilowii]
MAGAAAAPCLFCQIARSATSTKLLYSDEKVVAFQDINPSALRHYLVIPVEHIATVRDLHRRTADYELDLVFTSPHLIVSTIFTYTVWRFLTNRASSIKPIPMAASLALKRAATTSSLFSKLLNPSRPVQLAPTASRLLQHQCSNDPYDDSDDSNLEVDQRDRSVSNRVRPGVPSVFSDVFDPLSRPGEKASRRQRRKRARGGIPAGLTCRPNLYKLDGIKAEMKNGVLKVAVPKVKQEERTDAHHVQIE